MKMLIGVLTGLLYVTSLLPMWVHYLFSDALYLVVYHLIGYRKRVVRSNLTSSFPDKSGEELRQVERRFYHWFCDYLVETVKLATISESELRRRMEFRGIEKLDECINRGQSCAIYLGHYGNWEWVTSLQLWISPKGQCCQVYHVLENPYFDKMFLKLRQRFNSLCIPMAETLRELVRYRQKGQPVVIGYISDQVPFWNNIHHWCDFLNHDTPVLTGSERIVRKLGQAAFYLDMSRPRRGYYVGEFKLITHEVDKLPPYAVTDSYFRQLEQSIRRAPELWLWTHNRWKRTREEFNLRYNPETDKVDITTPVEELKRKKGLI